MNTNTNTDNTTQELTQAEIEAMFRDLMDFPVGKLAETMEEICTAAGVAVEQTRALKACLMQRLADPQPRKWKQVLRDTLLVQRALRTDPTKL